MSTVFNTIIILCLLYLFLRGNMYNTYVRKTFHSLRVTMMPMMARLCTMPKALTRKLRLNKQRIDVTKIGLDVRLREVNVQAAVTRVIAQRHENQLRVAHLVSSLLLDDFVKVSHSTSFVLIRQRVTECRCLPA